jgi:RNA ligase
MTAPILSYNFPIINNLSQIRDAIGELRFFAITDRGEHTFSTYKIVTSDTFPPLNTATNETDLTRFKIRREIRGLAFDSQTGELVSRCLHKFFNIGEKPETAIDIVAKKLTQSKLNGETVQILDKLDGSMVTPIFCQNKTIIRYRTKMGYGNVTSDYCENFVESFTKDSGRNKYHDFCRYWMNRGYTPIFEFYSPESAIILKYDHSFLTLIAIRHIQNGTYLPYNDMVQAGKEYEIESVSSMELNIDETSEAIVKRIKSMKGKEGCVMRFQDGTMLKVKTKWYSELHMCKHFLVYATNNTERHVWNLILDNKVDDTVAILNRDDEKRDLIDFNDAILKAITKNADRLDKFVSDLSQQYTTGQSFAAYMKGLKLPSIEQNMIFALKTFREREGYDPTDILKNRIKNQFMNRLDEVKILLGIPDLNFYDMRKKSLESRPIVDEKVFDD